MDLFGNNLTSGGARITVTAALAAPAYNGSAGPAFGAFHATSAAAAFSPAAYSAAAAAFPESAYRPAVTDLGDGRCARQGARAELGYSRDGRRLLEPRAEQIVAFREHLPSHGGKRFRYGASYAPLVSGEYNVFGVLAQAGGLDATYFGSGAFTRPHVLRADSALTFDWGLYPFDFPGGDSSGEPRVGASRDAGHFTSRERREAWLKIWGAILKRRAVPPLPDSWARFESCARR